VTDPETPEPEQESPEQPAPEPEAKPKAPERRAADERRQRQAASMRERLAREARDEVSSAFDSQVELRQAVQTAVQSVDKALQLAVALDRKCSGQLGRRLFLPRRLLTKATIGVLGTASHHLKKVAGQLDASGRQREGLLEEAVSGLDH
jgi:hypothetical protein